MDFIDLSYLLKMQMVGSLHYVLVHLGAMTGTLLQMLQVWP